MKHSAKVLYFLSKKAENAEGQTGTEACNLDNALSVLCREFSNFMDDIVGKEILDFGCGVGWQAIAIAKNGANFVIGIDTNQVNLKRAKELSSEYGLDGKVAFMEKLDECCKGRFDIIISQNSMEHFKEPSEILERMKWALHPNGKILITFGPPWFAPYGSHMYFFTRMPWVNILFSEKSVMDVRAQFRDDGARKYEEVESGLNKMSIRKFERTLSSCGLKIQNKKYTGVRNINFLSEIPMIRELFTNHISCVLAQE